MGAAFRRSCLPLPSGPEIGFLTPNRPGSDESQLKTGRERDIVTTKPATLLFILVAFFCIAAAHSSADTVPSASILTCDRNVLDETEPADVDRYMLRGSVCEGRYGKPVSALGGLRIVSLMEDSIDWQSLTDRAQITLRWNSNAPGTIHITALPIDSTSYQMDVDVPSQPSQFVYALDRVRRSVNPLRLGFVASMRSNPSVLTPVLLPLESDAAVSAKRHSLHLVMLAPRDIYAVYVSITLLGKDGAPSKLVSDRVPVKGAPWAENDAVDAELSNLSPGRYLVDILATPNSGLRITPMRITLDVS
jgi:hypothetical protein